MTATCSWASADSDRSEGRGWVFTGPTHELTEGGIDTAMIGQKARAYLHTHTHAYSHSGDQIILASKYKAPH